MIYYIVQKKSFSFGTELLLHKNSPFPFMQCYRADRQKVAVTSWLFLFFFVVCGTFDKKARETFRGIRHFRGLMTVICCWPFQQRWNMRLFDITHPIYSYNCQIDYQPQSRHYPTTTMCPIPPANTDELSK